MADVNVQKKDSKNKLLTASVIVVLCAIFAVGFIYGLNSVLAMEGAFPPAKITESLTVLPDTVHSPEEEKAAFSKADMVSYLQKLTDAALTNEAKAQSGRSYDIDNDTLVSARGGKLTDTLCFLADDIGNGDTELGKAMYGDFEAKATDFGEDMSGLLRLPAITAEDIESFDISYIYYYCPICGDTSDEYLDHCEDCGSTYPYNEQYRSDYNITLHLVNNEDVLSRNFSPRTDAEIEALFAEGMNGSLSLTKLDREYRELTVSFTVDRPTDKLKELSFTKKLGVALTASFEGAWAQLGTEDISFDFTQSDYFRFTWPGIELNEHEMSLEPKGTDNLIAALTCAEPTKMTVVWITSDPDVVTVDDEGYLKACKTDGGKATITASYEFNGKIYKDSCEVSVKYPVEATSMKKNKIKLAPGEEYQLHVAFDPKNATVQTLTWYTEDESIAAVDENGVVTAVSAGVVTVYSLSDDGYFRSSCKVTVE